MPVRDERLGGLLHDVDVAVISLSIARRRGIPSLDLAVRLPLGSGFDRDQPLASERALELLDLACA